VIYLSMLSNYLLLELLRVLKESWGLQIFNRVMKRFTHRCVRTKDRGSLSLRERLRELKCCTRKSRIAPTEPTVCCPPERRCGVLCRRAFSCCKCSCKRAEQRTKNTRAKHSLTSVAPPPLSEVHLDTFYWNKNYYIEEDKSPLCHPFNF